MADFPAFAQGGCRIRNARFAREEVIGTMACVVKSVSDPAARYVLGAAHVMNPGGYGMKGDLIEAELDQGWTAVAVLEDWIPLRDASGTRYTCDAAIARIIRPDLVSAGVRGIGTIDGVSRWAFEGKPLQAHGAISGRVVRSVVYSVDRQAPVFYEDWASAGTYALPFEKLILYGLPLGNAPAMLPGDSGTLVLDEHRLAVGMHIARTDDRHPQLASVCTPIEHVLSVFDVVIETDGAPASSAPAAGAVPAAMAPAPAPPMPFNLARVTDPDVLSERSRSRFGVSVMRQLRPHTLFGGCNWSVTPDGLVVDGMLERTAGKLVTVPRVWAAFRLDMIAAACEFHVPVELILATVCTESGGDPQAVRRESRGRMSVGLMQTLIGTASDMLPGEQIDEQTLTSPLVSLRAGAAYIANQRFSTQLDPPLVACAYNAGSLRLNEGPANRWRMAQHPMGTGAHADRFVQWFNDCFACFERLPTGEAPDVSTPSYWGLFRR